MNKILFFLILALFSFTYANDFAHQKEVISVYGTTIEITEDCKLYITYQNQKREEVPFVLNNLRHCSLMKKRDFEISHIPYIAAYGDYIFTVQAPIWNKEYKEYHAKTVTLMITKPKGKVYFSKLSRGGGYPLAKDDWQYRVASAIIRKKYKLPTERLEVEHRNLKGNK